MDSHDTYAPQSPDLSSFCSSPAKTQQAYNNAAYAQNQNQNHSQNQHQHQHQHQNQNQNYTYDARALDRASDLAEYGAVSALYMPPIPPLPMNRSFSNPRAGQQQQQQQQLQQQPQQHAPLESQFFQPPSQRPQRRARNNIPSYNDDLEPSEHEHEHEQEQGQEHYHEQEYITSPPQPRGGMSTHASSSATMQAHAPAPTYKDPNPLNIEIKTKFPVARIKRIMQADEEVGKVAQVTPVAVSKALELFMIALVGGAADKAKEKGGKKVTAQHLKSVVLGAPEQFDFLAEIVGKIGEAQEGAGGEGPKKRKGAEKSERDGADSASSEEEKKVKKGRGRKKKIAD